MRATEINKGTHKGDCDSNGQWDQWKMYCPTCHVVSKTHVAFFNPEKFIHKTDCKGKAVVINSTARLPRAKASKQQWNYFNRKFTEKQ
jgi:hypothetical protein